MRELDVFINDTLAGRLSEENERYVFGYDEHTSGVVSVTMPIRRESWVDKRVHPIFQMNLPEGALKEAIANSFGKYRKMDQIGFLEIIGPHVLGRVKFAKPDAVQTIETLDGILFGDSEELFDSLLEKYSIRSGVSGVQPKVLLDAYDKNTMLTSHYIVKSWSAEYPELAANEYFCMNACKRAGLRVPQYYLSENRKLFVMKRFDIRDNGGYFGFEDMCVLLGRDNDDSKYHASYEDIAKIIKSAVAPQNRVAALEEFFTALVMNHLLRNGDAHLKNYAILYDNDYTDASLSPLYDVVTTTVYNPKDIPALAMSGGKVWWKRKTYTNFGKLTCGIKPSRMDEIIERCIEAVRATKLEVAEYAHAHSDFAPFADRLLDAWVDELK
ncbi:MAG: type II toxin-antitoxin system HipA family toxin [Campylobacterales bacterium]|nr:type II toxin-antitoxin system HipA family toxin [Campylobacterales bacterium]